MLAQRYITINILYPPFHKNISTFSHLGFLKIILKLYFFSQTYRIMLSLNNRYQKLFSILEWLITFASTKTNPNSWIQTLPINSVMMEGCLTFFYQGVESVIGIFLVTKYNWIESFILLQLMFHISDSKQRTHQS